MSRLLFATGCVSLLLVSSLLAQDENRLQGHISFQMNKATSVAVHSEAKYVAAGFSDGLIMFLAPQPGKFITVEFVGAHPQSTTSVAFSPDGAWFATASADGTIKIWESDVLDRFQTACQTRKEGAPKPPMPVAKKTIKAHPTGVTAIAYNPDGKTIASGGLDGALKLWNVETLKPTFSVAAQRGTVHAVAFSPDGSLIATAGADKTAKLWKADGKLLHTLGNHEGAVLSVSFSADGKQLATASGIAKKSGQVRIFATETGKETSNLGKLTDLVSSVSFHPKLPRIATGGPDKKVRVWDTETKQQIYADDFAKEMASVVYSTNGKTLATVSAEEFKWWVGDWMKPKK